MSSTAAPLHHRGPVPPSADAPRPRPARLPLPPVGPAWFPASMGTGILATLLGTYGAGGSLGGTDVGGVLTTLAVPMMVAGWLVLTVLVGGFAVRSVRHPGAFVATVRDPAVLPLWGTVSMGLLAVGAATLTVLPVLAPAAGTAAVVVDAVLWTLGTLLGVATALGFGAVLVRQTALVPTPVWGLPIVPPMVSATTGALLVPHVPGAGGQFLLLLAAAACFALALALGLVVFGVAYAHHWRVAPLPPAASAAAWIPLGIVGQSTAAAQVIAAQSGRFLTAPAALEAQRVADGYGLVVLALGLPLVVWAALVTARGFLGRMPFTPGWWALTFPIGTLALGSHLLGAALTGAGGGAVGSVVTAYGWLALATLVCTWTLCSVASLRAVVPLLTRP
ncbi:hypothetical protein [Nocardioides bruguierae]|uniref:C4-dicarboxylate ABC transporter n=1 Tax=Nocardioides bruguierae TaxID=2945102 RepID=A0A9X2D7Z5_9ACTN|nr:hypothetical protein [Nocardioides bruguierae]MCM0620840.1 hypothetical protein [Nocardioides bruguierae]